MIDATTNRPLRVIRIGPEGGGGGRVHFATAQLDRVTRALDAERVPYWLDHWAVSVGGRQEVTGLSLSWKADLDRVQQILDALA